MAPLRGPHWEAAHEHFHAVGRGVRCWAIVAAAGQVVATWESVTKDEVTALNRSGYLGLIPCKLCGEALPIQLQVRDEAFVVEHACPDAGFREMGKTGA